MPNSITPLSFFVFFVVAMALVFGGFYWGYSIKKNSPSEKASQRTALIFLGLDLALIALTVLCLLYDEIFGGVVFVMLTALVSGILAGMSDWNHNGGRWF